MSELSERDQAVLRSIFDPTATVADVVDVEDAFDNELQDLSPEDKRCAEMCVRGVRLAEGGQFEEALAILDNAIGLSPGPARLAAALNDRAQLFRLMGKDSEAMSELERVLELTRESKGRPRAQALCQRGALLRRRGRDQEARRDFKEAAAMGSGFAKKQLVELNPYAALCNQMLAQVMKGEQIKL